MMEETLWNKLILWKKKKYVISLAGLLQSLLNNFSCRPLWFSGLLFLVYLYPCRHPWYILQFLLQVFGKEGQGPSLVLKMGWPMRLVRNFTIVRTSWSLVLAPLFVYFWLYWPCWACSVQLSTCLSCSIHAAGCVGIYEYSGQFLVGTPESLVKAKIFIRYFL